MKALATGCGKNDLTGGAGQVQAEGVILGAASVILSAAKDLYSLYALR
ncbi:MAG: hypothetical protein ACJ8AY_07105 [Gemmatimonadales bacterium]